MGTQKRLLDVKIAQLLGWTRLTLVHHAKHIDYRGQPYPGFAGPRQPGTAGAVIPGYSTHYAWAFEMQARLQTMGLWPLYLRQLALMQGAWSTAEFLAVATPFQRALAAASLLGGVHDPHQSTAAGYPHG